MTHLTDDGIRADLQNRGLKVADDTDFGCYISEDMDKSVQDDIETLKADPLLEGVRFRGFVLSTESGLLREL